MTLLKDVEDFLKRTGFTASGLGGLINNRQIVYRMRDGYTPGVSLEQRLRSAMAKHEPEDEEPPIAVANAGDIVTRRASTIMADSMNGLIAKMAKRDRIPFGHAQVLAHYGPEVLASVTGAAAA